MRSGDRDGRGLLGRFGLVLHSCDERVIQLVIVVFMQPYITI
jgi:hypothetical protein